jgi:Na+/proline symporter
MLYLSIDYLIVYAFLAITLYIGLRAGRGIKDIREYALANKSFGTIALVLTYLATDIGGGSLLGDPKEVFTNGIMMTVALLGLSISFVWTAIFIAPKMKYFDGCLTMGDMVERLYGRLSGVITGILAVLYALAVTSLQLVALGLVCKNLLQIDFAWSIVLGGSLIALYTSHGGIKAVTITDIFQFMVLFVMMPLLVYKVTAQVGGLHNLFSQVPIEKFDIIGHKKLPVYLTLFIMWSVFFAEIINPAAMQRLLMGKNGQQLRTKFLAVAAFDPMFRILSMLMGLGCLILYPTIDAKLIFPHLVQQLLPIGLKGLAMAGALAVIMSTAGAYLHVSGLDFAHNIIKPIAARFNLVINELIWARYSTVFLSIGAMIIAIYSGDSSSLLNLNFLALSLTGPLLATPIIAGILGLKVDKKSFYIAFFVTLLVFIVAELTFPPDYEYLTTLISAIVSTFTFLGVHIIQNKGFAIKKEDGQELIWKPRRKAFVQKLKFLIPTPQRIVAYSQHQVTTYGAPYILFGIFLLINYTIPYFIWTPTLPQYEDLMLYLRLIGGVLCVLLIVREKWAPWLLPYFPSFWHLTVMYCLPFTSTIMLLFTGASIEWVVNIFGIIILLFVLLDWLTATIAGILGISLAFAFYKLVIGSFAVSLSFTDKYLMIYQVIFGILIGLLFARRRQLRYDRLATDNQILAATEQETRQAHLETFIEKIRLIKTLKNADIQKLSTAVKEIRSVRNQVKKSSSSVGSLDKNLQDIESSVASVALALTRVDHRAMDYLRLEIKPIAIEQLLEQLQQQLPNSTLHYIKKTQQHQIFCDPIQLVKVLKNTIVALPNKEDSPQKDYYLTIQDTRLTYPLPMVSPTGDYVKPVPAIRLIISQEADQLPDLAASYTPEMSSSTLPNPTDGQELLLANNQRIIKAHYGYTNVDVSKQTSYDYYLYVVPVDVNEIRPTDMNDPAMELGVELVRANDQYPGAQEQEQAFLMAVQQKSSANIENVKEALELIKWYHGSVSRRSGEPYYLHPLAVAHIVLDWNQEEATIIGALLHDVVEDTPMLLENIDMMFGPEVVRVVDYVTHFESFKDSFYRGKLTDDENWRMLMEATDKRALYVKLADRMHNMRTIEGHKTEEKKKKIARETLFFFVSLAGKLGLEQAAKELLDMSTRVLNR